MIFAPRNSLNPCPLSKRIYSLNLNYSDFVVLNCSISNESCTFLVDSQVDISVIKCNVLKNNTAINEPSISNYNSPIILVPKKANNGNKKWRMCMDFHMLNKKLIPNS